MAQKNNKSKNSFVTGYILGAASTVGMIGVLVLLSPSGNNVFSRAAVSPSPNAEAQQLRACIQQAQEQYTLVEEHDANLLPSAAQTLQTMTGACEAEYPSRTK